MPIDAYMVFDPNESEHQTKDQIKIVGESSDALATGKGSFEITSFDWGASSSASEGGSSSSSSGDVSSLKKELSLNDVQAAAVAQMLSKASRRTSGGESTKHRTVKVGAFKINKPFDSASLGLFTACIDVECVFEKATVLFRKTDGKEAFVYLMFEFFNVRVDSVDWDFDKEGENQEKVEFSFEECCIFYSPQTAAGKKKDSWDKGSKAKASAFYPLSAK